MRISPLLPALLLLLLTGIFSSCDEGNNPEPDFKYEYFPLALGQWTEYRVDSVTFDNFFNPPKVDSTTSFIREEIDSTFTDNEGRENYVIRRYWRSNDSAIWKIRDVWYAIRLAGRAERVEENLRFIKLIFPPDLNDSWDGNSYINPSGNLDYLEGWTYVYEEVDAPAVVNGNSFQQTLKVEQEDKENLIEKVRAYERYAFGVGLVYKELQVLSKQNVSNPWTMPESGFIVRMHIQNWGPQ